MIKEEKMFIEHILENIKDIEEFSKEMNLEKFLKDTLRRKAIIRSLEIIGEAVKNLPIEFLNKYPHVEWKNLAGLRDKLIHHYFGLKLDIVWEAVKKDIPELKQSIIKIKRDLEIK